MSQSIGEFDPPFGMNHPPFNEELRTDPNHPTPSTGNTWQAAGTAAVNTPTEHKEANVIAERDPTVSEVIMDVVIDSEPELPSPLRTDTPMEEDDPSTSGLSKSTRIIPAERLTLKADVRYTRPITVCGD
jgi:hypothetical protein